MGVIAAALSHALDDTLCPGHYLFSGAPMARRKQVPQPDRRIPVKTDVVLYKDQISGEACAAVVVKVHVPGSPDSMVNVAFFTEEGRHDSACDVMYGPGRYGCYWFPGDPTPEEPANAPA